MDTQRSLFLFKHYTHSHWEKTGLRGTLALCSLHTLLHCFWKSHISLLNHLSLFRILFSELSGGRSPPQTQPKIWCYKSKKTKQQKNTFTKEKEVVSANTLAEAFLNSFVAQNVIFLPGMPRAGSWKPQAMGSLTLIPRTYFGYQEWVWDFPVDIWNWMWYVHWLHVTRRASKAFSKADPNNQFMYTGPAKATVNYEDSSLVN